jgi:hypothetical protein
MARCARSRARARRPRARALPAREADRQGAPLGRAHPVLRQHGVHQHDSAAHGGALARQRGAGGAHPLDLPLERHGDGGARQQERRRARRPHRELRLGGHALRHGPAALLARPARGPRRRPRLFPGAFVARHLCARPDGRPLHRGAAAQLPPRGRRQGRVLVPAPVADAGLLAVPDRVDGPRADPGDLHGALSQVSARARPRRNGESQGLGILRRRRDGRARVARRDRPCLAREARQPHLHRQLQPAAARRAGARQRQDHPGAGRGFPRRGLERDQGDLGLVLGSAARARQGRAAPENHGGRGRRRIPELQGERRRLRAQALLRQASEGARDGGAHVGRGHLAR